MYWEQRGTGKSFDSSIVKSSMTVEHFITDLDALVDAVRKRFGKDKVALYGHFMGLRARRTRCRTLSEQGFSLC
ncbi:MAG TPA: hypothetical protein VEV17_01600 [Bryobacteraceae bacterium]|nr:hypothetical protein [Bryobacteraceae bacterium]